MTEEPKMPFGKYRGKPLSEILKCDPSYLAWFYCNVDGNEDIKRAIRPCPASARRAVSARRSKSAVPLTTCFALTPGFPERISTDFAGKFSIRRRKSDRSGRRCGNENFPAGRKAGLQGFQTGRTPPERIPDQWHVHWNTTWSLWNCRRLRDTELRRQRLSTFKSSSGWTCNCSKAFTTAWRISST